MSDDTRPADGLVEILSKRTVFQGYFRVDEWRVRHRRFDGSWSGPVKREIFERGHAVGLLIYDPVRDEVALIEQFRVGALAAGWDGWLYEVVAGIIEPGESPADVAKREADEEAGCVVTELIPMIRYLATPGGSTESVHLYCALVDTKGLGGIHGLDHEDEDIRVKVVTYGEALAMLSDGRASNSMIVIALQWLALHRESLRRGNIPPQPRNWVDQLEPDLRRG